MMLLAGSASGTARLVTVSDWLAQVYAAAHES